MANRLLKSFGFALQGIRTLFKETPNAKIHLIVAIIAILLGVFFKISVLEWIIVVILIAVVFSAEAFNTAIETLTDLASPEIHPLAKKTKDMAAGAVLIVAITSVIVGFLLFGPRVYYLFF